MNVRGLQGAFQSTMTMYFFTDCFFPQPQVIDSLVLYYRCDILLTTPFRPTEILEKRSRK
jgi:hypothetical protein